MINNLRKDLLHDRNYVISTLQNNPIAKPPHNHPLYDDKEIVLLLIKNGHLLFEASNRLKNDKDVALAAVQSNVENLRFCSEEMQNDYDVGFCAIKQTHNFYLVGLQLRSDKNFILRAIDECGARLDFIIDHHIKNDKAIIMAALQNDNDALKFASEDLRNDDELVAAAIKINSKSISYASERIRSDKNFAKLYLEHSPTGNLFFELNVTLQEDKELAMMAVSKDGRLLRKMCDKLKNDQDVVFTAMERDIDNIQYASKKFKEHFINATKEEIRAAFDKYKLEKFIENISPTIDNNSQPNQSTTKAKPRL